ncbi:MAG: cysteine desulfurase [Candidatus Niyogibacteria bacterium]|nr:cysteine desulfurase [Candidatus Niyogibacteria bacterium]
MNDKNLIYLDHAATTPADPEVVLAMEPHWAAANPSSLHRCGQAAIKAVDDARETIADFVGAAHPREIIFTGSATEANNLAIRGVISNAQRVVLRNQKRTTLWAVHIITTAIEHASVLEPIHMLEKAGIIEVAILPVSETGLITPDAVAAAVQENTALVSIGWANNEIGTIQPIADIVRAVKAKNPKILVHTDAVQAAPWLDIDVKKLGVDLMTISAHKMYGPKGIGALYVKDGIKLEPVIYGGGQEYGLRSGTENVPGIAGFAKAAEMTAKWKKNAANTCAIEKLREYAWNEIRRIVPDAELNSPLKNRLPNYLNVFIPDADPEAFLIALSEDGVCVSSGSACAARSQTLSHVIAAIGKASKKGCHLRITLGRQTTPDNIRALIEAIKKRLSM